ncbi:MAG TPA: bacterial transcriptional activator domain-containing protein [Bacteroidota bacterium]|nr:bacterial transcriptional activator domain-containing protein [Bacteroidota bacterium]
MLKHRWLFLLTGFVISFSAIAQHRLDPAIDAAVRSGTDLLLRQEYRQAESIFQQLTKSYPQHPAGYIYQAAVMQAEAMDFMIPVNREQFEKLLEMGRQTSNNLASPWKEYFRGTADGYDAYERMDRGDWLGGINKGMSSASSLGEILEKDSSFYDACIGVGTYYYWRSVKTKWVPFVKDKCERGIELLELGAEHSEYNRYAAISGLISILLDAKQYDAVIRWSRKGLEAYPENRTFLWGLATAYDRGKHPQEAVQAYQTLLQNLLTSHASHPYNELVCRLNLAKCQLTVGDTIHAKENLNALLNFRQSSFPENLSDRAKAKFDDAENILSGLKR